MKDILLNYSRYNHWANSRICDYLKNISEEEMNREITSSFSSVRKTIHHTYGAQSLWISRLHGVSPSSFPPVDAISVEETLNLFLDTSRQLISFLENSSEDSLRSVAKYKNLAGEEFTSAVCDILQHVMNHSTYHRGQIITMLRQLGYTKLFPTDYIVYCREKVTA